MPKVSVTVITRNEGGNIAAALDSVRWVDELIVVDAESTDDTTAMARRFTDRVFVRAWEGYGDQKNFAAAQASYDWILSLDADEEEQSTEVRALASEDKDDSATVSVAQLLDQLPERYRQAVVLFYMEDKSYEQTAASLGLPLGTVKALLHRARKRLIELTRDAETEAEPAL